jgi:hypothetical protein
VQVADFNHEDFNARNQSSADDQLLVKFENRPVEDKAASLEAGRPIYKEKLYIDIKIPGDKLGGACRPARQNDISRFPRHYAAFRARIEGQDAKVDGTPLAEWPMMKRTQVEEMAFFNVHTVEALANLADVHTSKFMGINALKQKAKEWLEVAEKGAAAAQLATELEKRDAEIAELRAMIEGKSVPHETPELTKGQKAAATRKRNAEAKEAKAEQDSPPE